MDRSVGLNTILHVSNICGRDIVEFDPSTLFLVLLLYLKSKHYFNGHL